MMCSWIGELYPYFSMGFSGTEWTAQTQWLIRDTAGKKHCFCEDIWFVWVGFSTLQILDGIFKGGTIHTCFTATQLKALLYGSWLQIFLIYVFYVQALQDVDTLIIIVKI